MKTKIKRYFTKHNLTILLIITLGGILLNIGFYFFLLPSKLITGGVMGISVILDDYIPPAIFMYIVNGCLLLLSLFVLGKEFFFKTIYLSILSPTINLLLENILHIDRHLILDLLIDIPIWRMLISSIFGGLLVGVGLGLVLKHNASTGGMDILQKIMSKILKIPFSISMYALDGLVILAGFIVYIQTSSVDLLILAILSMVISGIVIDRLSIAGKAGYTVFIITDYPEAFKDEIFKVLDRGLSSVTIKGEYTSITHTMLICNVTKAQKTSFREIIEKVDSKAFIFMVEAREILGFGFSTNVDPLKLKNELKNSNINATIIKDDTDIKDK
ncbi:MAG: YitT family protein [Acholeplasmatales bacterium]|jgi:uncharacterized membrane-anchored protein YitT (DUF2179 family)|nr:YitT family protein [Acholeplasmatales bacterium]